MAKSVYLWSACHSKRIHYNILLFIIYEAVSDLTVLKVLSSVRHLGTGWPLAWAFFSISTVFIHSTLSFSNLWRDRNGPYTQTIVSHIKVLQNGQVSEMWQVWFLHQQLDLLEQKAKFSCFKNFFLFILDQTRNLGGVWSVKLQWKKEADSSGTAKKKCNVWYVTGTF